MNGPNRVLLESAGSIDQDLFCLKCGYNLRTLATDGRCPECGLDVGSSLPHPDLARLDPRWVASLASGARWMMRALLLTAALLVSIAVIGIVFHLPFAGVFGCGVAAAPLLVFFAVWLFTETPPSSGVAARFHRLAQVVRSAAVVTALGSVALGAAVTMGTPGMIGALYLTVSPFGVSGFVGGWAFVRYCRAVGMLINVELSVTTSLQYEIFLVLTWPVLAGGVIATKFRGPDSVSDLAIIIGGMGVFMSGVLILGLPTYLSSRLARRYETARRGIESLARSD